MGHKNKQSPHITINIKNTIWEGEKTRCFFNAIMEMIRITKRIILFM